MLIKNGDIEYDVGKQVAETKNYRLYLCRQIGTDRECLLQIAANNSHNGSLDHVAFLLQQLKKTADEIEAEYAKIKTNPNDFLNYDFGFPVLIDKFICDTQGNRRINILAFKSVNKIRNMVPIANIITKDKQRVDLRTSVWIIGKLLKILVFTHGQGITIGRIDANNILIEPDEHYVTIFDWSDSLIASEINQQEEIQKITQIIIQLLGGNYTDNFFPDTNEFLTPYTDFLLLLVNGGYRDAKRAHTELYDIADAIWPRAYYPFTSYQL